ncbi:glutamyl-tRNA reductase [Flavobacteriaceae bacterium]|nr:glutamyl-tRNA reductase [Flavobacteriaceae bacterium]MDB4152035.1 glutamyl-tRNA reductase [Flavobacteriaceae bacterium]MDC1439298.1 glutamyl-tRNA reductase [Flavobacteriaceae bacterium]|tara:strand:+ start:3060 stop:4307 length:1248 start_codon:yes stop_codon:yes gene_type:complete
MEVSNNKKHFYAIGVSYKNADLKTRGDFSLNLEQKDTLTLEAKREGIEEILINSTCNRTEIYAHVNHPIQLINLLCKHSKGSLAVFNEIGYTHKNKAAFHHIFKVGTGLDSQILGDFEIIGQLKQGFFRSKKLGMGHGFMERLVNAVIQASKRIKTETKISSGATSVAFASVQYIINTIEEISEKNILLFGTGKIGRNTCENLIKHTENDHIVLINRTHEKAKHIAGKFNVLVKEYGELPTEIRKTDVLIVATGAQQPTISKDIIHKDTPLLILDLSIPSNVHPNVEELEQVTLINLDSLSQITNKALEDRRQYIPQAEIILEEVKEEFLQWLEHRQYAPALRALKAKLTAQQSSEIKTQEKKAVLKPEAVSVSDQMIQKITGQLANYLKENPSKATTTLDVIQEVFQLDIKAHE